MCGVWCGLVIMPALCTTEEVGLVGCVCTCLSAGGSKSRVKSDLEQLLRSRTNRDGHQTGLLCKFKQCVCVVCVCL